MKINKALLPASLLALLLPVSAFAAEPGFYVGGKFGAASVDEDFIDDDDTSYGVYAGYTFNRYFALEGEYTNFGDLEVDIDDLEVDNPGVEPTSIGLKAVGMLPVSDNFTLLGSVGYHSYDLDPNGGDNLGDAIGDDSSTDLFYGVGAQFNFANNVSVRAMYDRFEFDGPDADEISLGVQYTF